MAYFVAIFLLVNVPELDIPNLYLLSPILPVKELLSCHL